MHPPPHPTGSRRKTRKRKHSRANSLALVVGIGLVLIASFGAGLAANEVNTVRRSGAVGHFAPIEIDSLPQHRPLIETPSSDSRTASEPPTRVAMVPRESTARSRSATPKTAPTVPQIKATTTTKLTTNPAPAKTPTAAPTRTPSTTPSTTPTRTEPDHYSIIKGKISQGQSLSLLLRAQGVSAQLLGTIDRQIRPEFDFRRSRPGDDFRLTLSAAGELVQFRYRIAPDESILLSRTENGYRVTREESPLQPKVIRMHGTVQTSLYKSIRGLGHDPALASAFADIFAWDIDFTRQLKVGDGYTILYEQLYREEDGDEIYVGSGRILAAQFKGSVGEHTAVYYEEHDGIGSYFRPDGDTLEQEYLVAPLKFNRISSHYSAARNHPILNVVRPHHGIDYAARSGTPLWSVADGTVIFRGTNGGFGNLVKIRHAGGYVSFYAHLSAFSPQLAVGQKVKQKQVIGFVGQTGLATGPHVCFRVTKYGKYVNPARLNQGQPIQRSVADAEWADFEIVRDQLLLGLRDGAYLDFAGNAL